MKLGHTYESFYSLTWYEWGFETLKLLELDKQQVYHQELMMELTGQVMALIANVNRDARKAPTPFKRSNFFKLSYDTQLTEEIDPELFNKVARRLGGRIKGKDGN